MPDFSSVESLDLRGKRVVVSGGTQGIGAGIARFSAQLGASVAIIGRNSTLGNEVINSFPHSDASPVKDHLFISADLSTIRGMKQAAQRVKDWAGDDNVFLLFQTQGGPPPAKDTVTEDGLDFHFAIQRLSRFVLTYTLAELGVLKDSTVLFVAGAGGGGDTVNLDNIDSKGVAPLAKTREGIAVMDAYTKEFNVRYKSLRVLHTYPGIVRTNVMSNSGVVWWLRILSRLFLALPFTSLLGVRTPEQYARIAMWLATSEEVKRRKEVVSWTQHGTEAKVSAVARDDALRVKVWEKMVSITEAGGLGS